MHNGIHNDAAHDLEVVVRVEAVLGRDNNAPSKDHIEEVDVLYIDDVAAVDTNG